MSLLKLPPTVVVHIVVDVTFLDPMGSVVAVNLVLVLVAGTFDFDLSLPLYHSLLLRPLSPSLSLPLYLVYCCIGAIARSLSLSLSLVSCSPSLYCR